MSKKKQILILQTGGTIAMREDNSDTVDFPKNGMGLHLREQMPELEKLATYAVHTLFSEDSSDLNPNHWEDIAFHIFMNYQQFDGFVIIHGTDTMAYTASFLSFIFSGLSKPIVLTGSQIPLHNVRSDARRNMINAVELACSDCNEVGICFNDKFLRGNRSTKMSIGDFDAFSSPNFPPLAEIGLNINYLIKGSKSKEAFECNSRWDDRIALIKVYPGMKPEYLNALINTDARCIIIEAFGSGNVSVKEPYNLVPFVQSCTREGKIVVITSQAPYDAVDLNKYANARLLKQAGAISAGDMTIEACVTKMMFLLGQHDNPTLISSLFQQNLAGERSS
jgi:L-asparaginase